MPPIAPMIRPHTQQPGGPQSPGSRPPPPLPPRNRNGHPVPHHPIMPPMIQSMISPSSYSSSSVGDRRPATGLARRDKRECEKPGRPKDPSSKRDRNLSGKPI